MSDLSQNNIDVLFAAAASEAAVGRGSARPERSVRSMNFARPSKFNKDQLRTLHMLHDAFCRRASTYLSGAVRSLADVNVTGAEQIPYGEFIASLPVPGFTAVLEITPLNSNAMLTMDLPFLFGMIDRILGGPGGVTTRVRELTDIETQLANGIVEHLLSELSETWGELVDVGFRLRGIEMNAQFAQIAASTEPSVLITMEASIGGASGSMGLCIPWRSVEGVVGDLTAHRYFSGGEEEATDSHDQVAAVLSGVQMPVRALVGERMIPIADVLRLQPGDVLSLGRRVDQGVDLVVGSTSAYRAVPGRDGDRLAVRVVGPTDEMGRGA